MKKVTLILAALALVLGISQCKKQESAHVGEEQHIMLTANNGNDGSKVAVESVATKLNLTWESTDKINVSGAVEGTLDLTGEPGSATAKFEGTVTRKTGDQVVFTVGSQPNYMNQDGTLEGTDGLKSRICLKGTSEYKEDGKYGNVLMELQYAVLKLDLSYFGPETGSTTVTIKAGGSPVASVTDITAASKVVYVALLPTQESNYTFTSNEDKTVTKNWSLAANTFYTLDEGSGTGNGAAIVVEPQAPAAKFTVGMDGDTPITVEFAPGNLQYLGKSDGTGTWRFAEHQWDYMGDGPNTTTGKKGNVDLGAEYEGKYNTGSGNAGGSETDADKAAARDLFGWGATGFQDTRSHTYQTNYQPYSTSNTGVGSGHAAYNINKFGYGPDYYSGSEYNLTVENKSDWGCLAIGGYTANTWRTLSSAEWAYLLGTRTTVTTGLPGESSRYAKVTVNGVSGMLLFPDSFAWDASKMGTAPTSTNTGSAAYTTGTYTEEQFAEQEKSGVVFLPAAGSRSGASLYSVGSYGRYWSSSCYTSNSAYNIYFNSDVVGPQNSGSRCYGFSVRLVR